MLLKMNHWRFNFIVKRIWNWTTFYNGWNILCNQRLFHIIRNIKELTFFLLINLRCCMFGWCRYVSIHEDGIRGSLKQQCRQTTKEKSLQNGVAWLNIMLDPVVVCYFFVVFIVASIFLCFNIISSLFYWFYLNFVFFTLFIYNVIRFNYMYNMV